MITIHIVLQYYDVIARDLPLIGVIVGKCGRSFSDCIGISGEIEDCKWICRIVSSSGNEVEIVGSSWGQEMCRKC